MSRMMTLCLALPAASAMSQEIPWRSSDMAGTFSIVARDPATGQLGVAVQSHWFSVGSMVVWVEAGVGAVATQALVDVSYGPLGLQMMKAGKSPEEAMKALTAGDKTPEVRQVAMVDARGHAFAHTGSKCIDAAGHVVGDGFTVEANMMGNDKVWPAMDRAFRETKGDLASRMLAALDAAQAAGGDIRGRQSAAIKIVSGTSSGKPWADTIYDLRVEDAQEPLHELRRLVRLQDAYRHASRGDDLMAESKVDEALKEYAASAKLAPEIEELPFWQAMTLCGVGKVDEALPILRDVFRKAPAYRELVKRLPKAGLIPDDPALLARIASGTK